MSLREHQVLLNEHPTVGLALGGLLPGKTKSTTGLRKIDMGASKRRKLAGTYPDTRSTAKPIWERTPTMSTFGNRFGQTAPCTLEEYRAGESEDLISLHEASHALGCWAMGLPIRRMVFLANPEVCRSVGYSEAAFHSGARAVTIQRGSIEDKLAQPYGERLVLAKKTAFVELSGVWGASGEAYSTNPVMQDRTQRHFNQAATLYQTFLSCRTYEEFETFRLRDANTADPIEAIEEIQRLVPIVRNFFASPIVRALTQGLSNLFLENRHLEGNEIYEFLDEGWIECDRITAEMAAETGAAEVAEVEVNVQA